MTVPDMPAPEPTRDIVEAAAQWLAHLESGEANEADNRAYLSWRDAHPAHALAIQRMGGLAASIEQHDAVERETLRRLLLPPRRRIGGAVLGLGLLIGAGLLVRHSAPYQVLLADERTPIGVTRRVSLADDSRITLSTDSAVALDRDSNRQHIRLLQGELLAVVARQHHAPFTVVTSDGTAEAMGTEFTVRKDASGTEVAVISSHVRVCPAGHHADACLILGPGQRARLAGSRALPLSAIAPGDAGAWSEGWLPVEDRPLIDVLDDFNRWRQQPIRFDRDELAGLRVSGVFPLSATDRALDNLAQSQPILIDRHDPERPQIRRRSIRQP
ncbi:FecR family protein [Novosphingobium rosa]|uniref:FecR family protein n=1 Tax=Novosphingobium rosa TaxID=76978 RepID=UPI0014710F26|nr:FecR domain-containing protein [Novosphingobium rosa]